MTILDTPSDVADRGLIRVRHEEGVSRGKVTDQQLRFIQPLTPPNPTTTATPTSLVLTREVDGPWPPEVGHRLLWPSVSGELEWVVEKVDLRSGEVELIGEVFGTEQRRTAHLRDVEPPPITITRELSFTDDEDGPDEDQPAALPAREQRPEKDEREALERTIDRLIFSEACLRQYHRDYAIGVEWERASGSLERLLRNKGRLIRKYRGEYLRIRTRHFDLRVVERPTDENPYIVYRLHPRGPIPRKHRRKRRRRGSTPPR